MMQRHTFGPKDQIKKVWKSAQLLIGFHKDRDGRPHQQTRTWSPDNGKAGLHTDASRQETFIALDAASGRTEDDVQIKLRPDQIALRRDNSQSWQGVIVKDDCVVVRTADGAWIKVDASGAVIRQTEWDETVIEADGSVNKRNKHVEAIMSGDGVDMARSTPDNVAFVTGDKVACRSTKNPKNLTLTWADRSTSCE